MILCFYGTLTSLGDFQKYIIACHDIIDFILEIEIDKLINVLDLKICRLDITQILTTTLHINCLIDLVDRLLKVLLPRDKYLEELDMIIAIKII